MNVEDPIAPARGCCLGFLIAGSLWVATFAVMAWMFAR